MTFLRSCTRITVVRRRICVATVIAVCFFLAFPGTSEAHAILFQSDPAANAVLIVPPDQVRLWFSEALNPAFSTVVVVNEANQRIDNHDAQISPDSASEVDVTLPPNLSPGVYAVVWRSDANDDGHILTGSFEFTIANPDGTIPTLKPGTLLGQNALGGDGLSAQYTGQLDGPTLFNLLVITLVELGAVFWVGASLWLLFVLQPVTEEHPELQESNRHTQQRFEQRWVVPVLLCFRTPSISRSMSFYPWFCRFAVTMLPKAMTRNMASLITRSRKGEKGQKITEIQVSVKSFCETMLPHGSEGSRTAREKRRFCSFSSFCEKNFCKTMLPLICKTMGKMTSNCTV